MKKMSDDQISEALDAGKIPFNRAVIQASNILKREIDGKKISTDDWYHLQLEIDSITAEMKRRKGDAKADRL